MAYRIEIKPRAERDLELIYQYIRADSSDAAQRWFTGLREAIRSLASMPERGLPVGNHGTTIRSSMRLHPIFTAFCTIWLSPIWLSSRTFVMARDMAPGYSKCRAMTVKTAINASSAYVVLHMTQNSVQG